VTHVDDLFGPPPHPVQQAIDKLMAVCDGAKSRDGVGFSKPDVSLIKYDAAPADVLDDAELARRLCKYHRQLGEYLTNKLKKLAGTELHGAQLSDSDPGVLFVEEDFLKLYGDNAPHTDRALRAAGAKKFKHASGFRYVEPHNRILHLRAAGFRVADRVIEWCAQNFNKATS